MFPGFWKGGNNHAHLKFWPRLFQFLWLDHKSFDAGLLTLRCHKLLSQNAQAPKEQSGLSFLKSFSLSYFTVLDHMIAILMRVGKFPDLNKLRTFFYRIGRPDIYRLHLLPSNTDLNSGQRARPPMFIFEYIYYN